MDGLPGSESNAVADLAPNKLAAPVQSSSRGCTGWSTFIEDGAFRAIQPLVTRFSDQISGQERDSKVIDLLKRINNLLTAIQFVPASMPLQPLIWHRIWH